MKIVNAYELKSFYNSVRGRIVRSLIRQKISDIWLEAKNLRFVGFGYALPYLRPYMKDSERVCNMMPQQLGVHQWPFSNDGSGENIVCINEESQLPLETNSVDRIVMVHALEFLDTPEETFEEIWRVLKSTGRLLIIVPNRLGFWARADWNPFGQGRPYSTGQVESFLRDNLFVHERTDHALFSPPFQNNFLLRGAHFFEKIGPYVYPALGGVSVIEASKQIYANKGKGVRVKSTPRKAAITKPIASPIKTPRLRD